MFEDEQNDGQQVDGSQDDGQGDERSDDRQRLSIEQLGQVMRENNTSQLHLNQLLSDPDIAKLWRAKQAGQKAQVQLPSDEEQEEAEPQIEDGALDAMTPSQLVKFQNQQLAKTMPKMLRNVVKDLLAKQLEQQVSPITQKLDQLYAWAGQRAQKEVQSEFATLRAKYPDLNLYAKDVDALRGRNPDLQLEEAYMIAKRRKVGDAPTRRQVSTERPNAGMGRRAPQKREYALGEKGLQEMIQEAFAEQPELQNGFQD